MFNNEALKEWIIKNKYSNAKFALLVGCSEQMIDFLRRGVKQPSLALLVNIKKVTGLNYNELILE